MNNFEIIKEKRALVEDSLAAYLSKLTGDCPETLSSAMRYSVCASGKRLRPLLCLAASDFCGGLDEAALPFACAIEFIHTYSLIHDDLPAMDDDDFRRGKPANHKVFGEAAAILAGDALLNLAFEVMAERCVAFRGENFARAALAIAEAAGSRGMAGGQMSDIEHENVAVSETELLYIHSRKTGRLISASLVAGAFCAGADEVLRASLTRLGEKIGLAFQIKDDILNVCGDPSKLGKPVKTDERGGKATYVSLFGMEKAKADYSSLYRDIINGIELIGGKGSLLFSVAESAIYREN
jgi:geranylgeranyl diphosphate synthase type II